LSEVETRSAAREVGGEGSRRPGAGGMPWFFVFFLVSGFCSILYELLWMRLAMAAFGVTTALTAIVLSVFMGGLGLGSWGAGRWTRGQAGRAPAMTVYAGLEALIGVSALVVPLELHWGRGFTEQLGQSSSFSFYIVSGVWVAGALLPWCACMGATIPVGMQAIAEAGMAESKRAFSYLYLANVTGAVAGTVVPLFLIELLGFRGTLRVGAGLNFWLAVLASGLGWWWRRAGQVQLQASVGDRARLAGGGEPRNGLLALLFLTGLTSMAMEVVWIRQFTPYLGTVVYAFAAILGCYLWATSAGVAVYRRWNRSHRREGGWMWALLGLSGVLAAQGANPWVDWSPLARLGLGIIPFSALLGFLTPMLVDRWSGGDPDRVGTAYAVNIAGCIAGPLLGGFVLLPLLDERWVLLVLASPWLAVGVKRALEEPTARRVRRGWAIGMALAAVAVAAKSQGYESWFAERRVLRDNTATVIATEVDGSKRLLVNGVGITTLSPITKMMAHLPLVFLDRPPQNALAICFGMGTTFRSLLSWGIPVTAVELVPSVPRMFGYFYPDGPELLRLPRARVVIDDGRRFLERTTQQYDVITIDPPPPVEAAGSSLLYTREFYETARKRLRPGGILQQWLPTGHDPVIVAGVTRALLESFPYVRAFPSVEGWGMHYLASDRPLTRTSDEALAARMPATAVRDMMEWGPKKDPAAQIGASVDREVATSALLGRARQAPGLVDDRPLNEYFLLRRNGWSLE
jgi:spermidine synthase